MSFCVHLIWIYRNPCMGWQWKTMFDLFWAFLILSILILKHGSMILLIFSFNILELWQWFIKASLGRTILGFISCCHRLDSSKVEFILTHFKWKGLEMSFHIYIYIYFNTIAILIMLQFHIGMNYVFHFKKNWIFSCSTRIFVFSLFLHVCSLGEIERIFCMLHIALYHDYILAKTH